MDEEPGNEIDDDCNSTTPDYVKAYNIVLDMMGSVVYETWLPDILNEDVTATAKVFDLAGVEFTADITFTLISVTSYEGSYTNDPSILGGEDFTHPFPGMNIPTTLDCMHNLNSF